MSTPQQTGDPKAILWNKIVLLQAHLMVTKDTQNVVRSIDHQTQLHCKCHMIVVQAEQIVSTSDKLIKFFSASLLIGQFHVT